MNEEETIDPIVVDEKRQRLIEKFLDSGNLFFEFISIEFLN